MVALKGGAGHAARGEETWNSFLQRCLNVSVGQLPLLTCKEHTHTLPLFPHTLFPTHRNPTLCAPVSLDLTQSPIKRILLILLLTKHQQSLFGSIPHVLLVRSTEIDQLVDALFGLQNMKNRLTPDTRVRTVKKQIEDGDC